jgi:hypothetical protein
MPPKSPYQMSLLEVQKNPMSAVRDAPVAVMFGEDPLFYVLPPKQYEEILGKLSKAKLADLMQTYGMSEDEIQAEMASLNNSSD